MQIIAKVDRPKVRFDQDTKINLMLNLTAPDVDLTKKRNPLAICAVLDRSGSMAEKNKIGNLRKTMYKLIDNLSESDSLGLVFFDTEITFVEFSKMNSTNKERFKKEIASVDALGGTDIGSALVKSSEMFSKFEGPVGSVERVLLLTDVDANNGAPEPEHFIPIMKQFRKGVGMSTFGYGERYNEKLMEALSKEGKGANYFIETIDSVATAFATELGGLLTCFAQDIKIKLIPNKGTEIINVLNDFDVKTEEDKHGNLVTTIDVTDIYRGENKKILIQIDAKKRDKALPREVSLADVSVSFRVLETGKTETLAIKPKIEFVKDPDNATKEADKEITEQVALLEVAILQEQAKKLADAGQWKQAKEVLQNGVKQMSFVGTVTCNAYAVSLQDDCNMIGADYCADSVVSKKMSSTYTSMRRGMRGVSGQSAEASGLYAATGAVNYSAANNTFVNNMVDNFNAPNGTVNADENNPPINNPQENAGGTGYTKNRKAD